MAVTWLRKDGDAKLVAAREVQKENSLPHLAADACKFHEI
jgi:hypothetical protein